jgi:hypothetical protein
MRSLRRNSHRFLAARRMEGAVPSRFLRAIATGGAKHFGAAGAVRISRRLRLEPKHFLA